MLNTRLKPLYFFLLGLLPIACSHEFTLPVLPDTQVEVNKRQDMFYNQMHWLADHYKALKFPMVLHVGDIVDYNNHTHYQTADKGFKLLDSVGLPYALAVGNHDTEAVGEFSGAAAPGNVNANLRKTTKFNQYFPVSRLTAQKGRYEEGKSDNAYYTFKAGGLKWLVLSLEFCARPGAVDWANTVLPRFPDHNVIVLTHYHLNPKGEISKSNAGYGDLSPQAVFDRMIRRHPNVLLVLSGHLSPHAFRTDKGDAGNTIYQLMQDYQTIDSGGGYIRLLNINPRKKSISASMYSPFYQKTLDDKSALVLYDVAFIK